MRLILLALATVAALVCATGASGAAGIAPPTAGRFEKIFVARANGYAAGHGERIRFVRADCLEGSSGDYLCAYTTRRPGGGTTCRLMHAVWTPGATRPFRVVLAGRTPVCGSVRHVLASLD